MATRVPALIQLSDPRVAAQLVIIIIIMAGMAVFNVAGYLIEERRRWPVITASPRGQCSTLIQNLVGKACSDEETVPVTWVG